MAVDAQGAARGRRLYEREAWVRIGGMHEDSTFGLPVVESERVLDSRDWGAPASPPRHVGSESVAAGLETRLVPLEPAAVRLY